ncbi:MAG: AAA family ATPase [Desulfobacteraceae bacterium]|uniref:AAA family ATPase n=1 Tax=Candidatus Desulfacyla euxinica TaxID=2841693 RepID=A0A8J6T536_9DELT|nr:AAA family ATPase [Candidatus Desulfacyla euxinica]MBL6979222.1 AAA family ATPase [Desulfobacteraceae bacterium]MBL7216268.1 AAA family ATPase [Desulfobacteraceae bacterium]
MNWIERMVFLSGPRQVGKTTIVKQFSETWRDKGAYFSWDISSHRRWIFEVLKPIQTKFKGMSCTKPKLSSS